MKRILLATAITLGMFTSKAQEFKASEKYTLVNERVTGQEVAGGRAFIDLVSADDTSHTLATLTITELQLLEEVHLFTLTDPQLEDVVEVLKVELVYSACCTSTDTYYFLVSEDRDLTALPHIENIYCTGFEPDVHYFFPSQNHGQEGKIVRAKKHYTETYTIKDVEIVQSFVWNDDDFESEEAISAIND